MNCEFIRACRFRSCKAIHLKSERESARNGVLGFAGELAKRVFEPSLGMGLPCPPVNEQAKTCCVSCRTSGPTPCRSSRRTLAPSPDPPSPVCSVSLSSMSFKTGKHHAFLIRLRLNANARAAVPGTHAIFTCDFGVKQKTGRSVERSRLRNLFWDFLFTSNDGGGPVCKTKQPSQFTGTAAPHPRN